MHFAAGAGEAAPHIAIILPAYNEASTIAQTMRSFYQALPDAELIVVGSRELSAPARLFLGSVSGQVMSQATCNVLVVRGRVSVPLTAEDEVVQELV